MSESAQEVASNSSDGIDDGSDRSHSDSGSESEKDIEHLVSPKLPDHKPKYYIYGVGNSGNACLEILQYLPI